MGGPGPSAPPPAPAPAASAPVVLPPGKRELVGFLVSYQSDPAGTFFPLYGGRNLVGRAGASDTLDIAINDPTTSSNHAAIVIESATRAVHIEDLGSTNGTFLNEEALGPQGRRDARDNDRVRFGGYTLVLKVVYRP